jgi:hypothetical protein
MVLHVDLVGSTKMAMRLPIDRLTMIIQAFNQEMSVAVRAFGGYILKYVGDAVLGPNCSLDSNEFLSKSRRPINQAFLNFLLHLD